jgi:hypothetical protein
MLVTEGVRRQRLELVEVAFDMVRLTVKGLLPTELFGIIALVSDHDGAIFEPADQALGAENVVDLTRRDQEVEGGRPFASTRVDLGGETASAPAHTTISTPFFAPEAC